MGIAEDSESKHQREPHSEPSFKKRESKIEKKYSRINWQTE